MTLPEQVLVADWGIRGDKRVVYRVNVAKRYVTRLNPPEGGWCTVRLVDTAVQLGGSVLVLIDVAIGLPLGLFNAMREACGHANIGHFMDFLRAHLPGEWLGDVHFQENWSVRTPYIHVPPGNGALTGFENAASEFGVCLRRAIDQVTGGRSPLILSGIPGTVGSGSRNVIRSLGNVDVKMVATWPFDGPLAELLASGRVIVGEIYPRALYGHALLDLLPHERYLLAIGKTKGYIRDAAIDILQGLQWHQELNVKLSPELMQRARANEDEFDTYLSSLGILRLLLENVPLDALRTHVGEQGQPLLDNIAEGGMLGVLATQLDHGQRAFVASPSAAPGQCELAGRENPRGAMLQDRPMGPWVRVSRGIIDNAARHQNNRQIAFSGLPKGTTDAPVWVELLCEGREYMLTIMDTTSCFRSHQVATAEDFDSLYDLLSARPDERVAVELIEDRPADGEDLTEGNVG